MIPSITVTSYTSLSPSPGRSRGTLTGTRRRGGGHDSEPAGTPAGVLELGHASSFLTCITFLDQLEMRAIFFLKIQQRRSRDGLTLD